MKKNEIKVGEHYAIRRGMYGPAVRVVVLEGPAPCLSSAFADLNPAAKARVSTTQTAPGFLCEIVASVRRFRVGHRGYYVSRYFISTWADYEAQQAAQRKLREEKCLAEKAHAEEHRRLWGHLYERTPDGVSFAPSRQHTAPDRAQLRVEVTPELAQAIFDLLHAMREDSDGS